MKAYPYRRTDIARLAMTGVSARQAVDLVLARHAEGDLKEKLAFAHVLGAVLWALTQPALVEGVRTDPEGGWTAWKVFPREKTDEEILAGMGCSEGYYSGPGRSFAHPAIIRRKGTRALVKQSGGLDI